MDFHKFTIKELSRILQKKEISSLDLCNFFLDRIRNIDSKLKTCISVFEEEAKKQAILADKMIANGEKGELIGIPYLVKDNMLVKGFKTTAASKMLENYIAPYDATVIKRLKDSGAVLLGKTNMDEFAHGASTENSAFFVTKNPWDLERVPGGSSGGSASAVSAGLCVFALGSDTGGSIRQPASFCGVSGLKPSYSRVSRFGLISMTSSTDVIGPIAKSVEDVAMVMKVISGFDENDLSSANLDVEDYLKNINKSIKGLKIGVVKEFVDSLDEKFKEVINQAILTFENLGAKIKFISLPYNKYAGPVYYIITPSEISSNLARLDGIRYGFSADYKSKGSSAENLNELYLNNRGQSFGPEVKRRIMLGTYTLSSGYFDAYYKKAMAVREKIEQEFNDVFSEVDVILTPTSPHVAFKIGEKINDPVKMYLEDIFVTGPSLSGLPAISIPAGFVDNLPLGIQIFANKFKEDLVLNLANNFQSKTDFHKKSPDIN
ncbi:Asp-tRNA(Asn)/Glu-tRNA(Gln) amidotransferase GatCAB subunit A [Candidatus Falkowbacteria bacterium HGW-Falkowbacteria-1]|jgi:aspartyl-tRNA(Asn)/glutamyl-tRNA(Gln) amidotransferase subunit A|uniref:Glutamyl-tRNA(Gln) amidotransferase subunit A n=1 Tax=Candidatus Falkowbacteria bacterium HGW-Falkowbacteria-1 TaxID=2013768 RepID=A0A2N2EAT6_9BACT|nr:MAG: Asp-tRNA(Asn)/Glu-tRNA(Gln) amidotransferase GatCAB subunit A [Candidatus Falkowbacteria bacterium HGW-Falkowbacteria-1]